MDNPIIDSDSFINQDAVDALTDEQVAQVLDILTRAVY